ncbi:uncharacterized protein LOC125675561 isoform X2 [Ostrea edulis]|uniref:uncharacterized protein LOC125675561 isoform X2 n=1 Tax=Ostrea edulis TaxID=37623 RepID=UPI0024AFDE9C|nr:uncharacterized protein LOC125675561 isoform X2 [Ostrea edulis]
MQENRTMPQRHIHRRPTIPLRKEERKSLSDLMQEPLIPSPMLADLPASDGRTVATLQRSDSYKQATSKENRISVLFGSNSDFHKKDYDKEKYKTLPSQIGTVRLTSRATSGQRRRSASSNLLDRQESGIVPSPDTDEDQKSSGSARKKKSRIQKIKERVLHSFQKQTITEEERRQKKREKQGRQKKVQMRRKKMKSSSLEIIHEHCSENVAPQSRLKRIFSFRKSHKVYNDDKDHRASDMVHKKDINGGIHGPRGSASDGITSRFRDSVDGPEKPVDAVFKTLIFGEIPNGSSVNSESKERAPVHHIKRGDRSGLSLDLPSSHRGGRRVVRRYSSKDESKEKVSSGSGWSRKERRYVHQVSVYSDIEIDGDEIDSPETSDKHKKDARSFDELSSEEREHRISEVANRLKFIGDKAVEKFNTESSSPGVESPHREVGGHGATADDHLVQQLVEEFRREGDRFSEDYNLRSFTPIVVDIAKQHTYTQFKKVIHTSLQNTIGWEQIALYFYLTRTAVHVAKGSVGLAQMAYDYFRETYSGWVEDRGGWETMLEETDCELD